MPHHKNLLKHPLKQAEAIRAPLRESLEQLNQEFAEFLAAKYVPKTVRKHTGIVDLFIHFICGYTDVENIEEITKGVVNSHFRSWYKRKVLDSATESDLRVALRKFFQFLAAEKGMINQKVLDALKGVFHKAENSSGAEVRSQKPGVSKGLDSGSWLLTPFRLGASRLKLHALSSSLCVVPTVF